MSTRSEIAVVNEDGSIKSIYCHSDGYIEYMGVLLNNYYNDLEKAKEIINENDCSMLSTTIYKSRFYNSWRGENTKAKEFTDLKDLMNHFRNDIFVEYIYLFKKGLWFVSELKFIKNPEDNFHRCISYHTKFKPLSHLLSLIDKPYNFEEVA